MSGMGILNVRNREQPQWFDELDFWAQKLPTSKRYPHSCPMSLVFYQAARLWTGIRG